MTRQRIRVYSGSLATAAVCALAAGSFAAAQQAPAAGPVIVLETVKGVIEIETFPQDAPKTVAHILALVKRGFYNGLRFHRVQPKFVVQIGDPQTRDMSRQDHWGSGGSGKPIGAAEISKTRRHVRGAVSMAHSGSAESADSQFYIMLRAAPELDGKHAVFGRVIRGMDVVTKLERTDILRKASVKE